MFGATFSKTATATAATIDSDDDLHALLSEQRHELMAAQSLESDFDFAFQLQLHEAISASLSQLPSSSSSSSAQPAIPITVTPAQNDSVSPTSLLSDEISRLQQELKDRKQSEEEMRSIREDLHRRMHDQKLAREILVIPEDEWTEWGDNFEKPFGEGCSKSAEEGSLSNDDVEFRLYFKGLVTEEWVGDRKAYLGGIGVAICDPRDNIVFEIRKPLISNGTGKSAAEANALIEGLNAALALELKRIVVYCDCYPLYQFIIGRWPARQRKVATLVDQVSVLRSKFTSSNPVLVPRNDIKYAFKFARDAIMSQVNRPAEISQKNTINETCSICLDDTDVGHMFSIDGCQHRYCFSCMKQHVEVKLLHGMVPKCPHEGCKFELIVESCRKFLPFQLVEKMNQRIKEAAIPVTEKVYCPYPKCSALMTKTEVSEYAKDCLVGVSHTGARKCLKCHGLFCINCKVPWHNNLSCIEYKSLHPNPPSEDLKLKSLATRNLWRQCVKCNHMIELSEGCYHMVCRCGYEFCYNCGANWQGKKPTCGCPLWHEDNILHRNNGGQDIDEEDDDDDDWREYDMYDSDSDDYF